MYRFISLILWVGTVNAQVIVQASSEPVQFPLRNIQNSISYGSNYNSSELLHFINEKSGYILNLAKLELPSPPNPYPGFIESDKVVAVNLEENGIYRISPGSFDDVPNLQYLDLSKNKLAFCDFFNYGSSLEHLKTLVIEENRLPGDSLYRDISKAGSFPRVQRLLIRKNHIQRLSFSLSQSFPRLVSLHLSDNEIDNCAFIRDAPSTLACLYVERNSISGIGSSIIRNLKSLKADGNIIQSICYKNCDRSSIQLLGATRLVTLSLSENKIRCIEACAFRDTLSLTSLNLSGNVIETINPSTFTALRALVQLRLDNNLLTSVPNLNGNWNLKTLSLRNNRLVEIKWGTFSGLWCQKLQYLLLAGNSISTIAENSFNELTELRLLDLSNNKLDYLPVGWMQSLRKLDQLDLRNNRFNNFYQLSLITSTSLLHIYLQDNHLDEGIKDQIQNYCPRAQIHLQSCQSRCNNVVSTVQYTSQSARYEFNFTSNEETKIEHNYTYGIN